jgi:hypothetical protein
MNEEVDLVRAICPVHYPHFVCTHLLKEYGTPIVLIHSRPELEVGRVLEGELLIHPEVDLLSIIEDMYLHITEVDQYGVWFILKEDGLLDLVDMYLL